MAPSSSIMMVLASAMDSSSSSASSYISSSSTSSSSSVPQVVVGAPESGSVLNGALGDYAVLDSACSHRPVFKSLALFDRVPDVDASVKVTGSDGNTTTAAAWHRLSLQRFTSTR
jgi:hypothetical protein